MKLWIDDEQPPPIEERDEWTWFDEPAKALKYLSENYEKVKTVALDNDMGGKLEGYDILCWIERQVHLGRGFPEILILTYNPVARDRMNACLKRIKDKGI